MASLFGIFKESTELVGKKYDARLNINLFEVNK